MAYTTANPVILYSTIILKVKINSWVQIQLLFLFLLDIMIKNVIQICLDLLTYEVFVS